MELTLYTDINLFLDLLLRELQRVLDQKLVGVYLYGSLVWGDFDYENSDIDMLVVSSEGINDEEFDKLDQMHKELAGIDRRARERMVEIAYMSVRALKTFKTARNPIAIISPGEPFHRKEAGNDWLINWYCVREKGVALLGPSPKTLIEPISKEEFVLAIEEQTKDWRDWISHDHGRNFQSYAILTICRALYAHENGDQVSKVQAASWAEQQLPEFTSLIERAIAWRKDWRNSEVDPEATYPETVKLVNFVIDQII